MAPDRTRYTHTDPNRSAASTSAPSTPHCAARRSARCTPARWARRSAPSRRCATGRAGSSAWCRRASCRQSLAERWRDAVADHRRGQRCGAGTFAGRGVGDPAPAAAADARAAARRAAGDVRTPRRDPALGLRGSDRARPRRRGAGQRRGAPAARLPPGPVDRIGPAGVPAHLRPRCARRGARHRRPGAGGEPFPRSPIARTLGGRSTIRDRTELQGALGELELAEGADRLAAVAGARGGQQAAHHRSRWSRWADPTTRCSSPPRNSRCPNSSSTGCPSAVGEPALVALLLGKTAQADERGIELTITEDTHLPSNTDEVPLTGQEMVTVLGNLIDNAMDACDRDDPWVEVTVQSGRRRAADPRRRQRTRAWTPTTFAKAMQRGYSTKSGRSEQHGLGLALVGQVVSATTARSPPTSPTAPSSP